MCTELEVERIIEQCEQVLNLYGANLSDEYFYQSLSLCVIDAVYSLGARYNSTQQAVIRYCKYFGLQRIRINRNEIPPIESQDSISDFLRRIDELGIERFTNEIFNNRQRTSTRNGILKSEAVSRFTRVLKNYNVNYLQSVSEVINNIAFEEEIRRIPGQTSGISLKYFFMLAGSENFIKPDRFILRFLQNILERMVTPEEAQICLTTVSIRLRERYPHLTPRLLDHRIWQYQRTLQ